MRSIVSGLDVRNVVAGGGMCKMEDREKVSYRDIYIQILLIV
jgi:hypothetical protein